MSAKVAVLAMVIGAVPAVPRSGGTKAHTARVWNGQVAAARADEYERYLESIRAWAGESLTKTRMLPRDPEFLIDPETEVKHYVIAADER
jgi:hypothetical protein